MDEIITELFIPYEMQDKLKQVDLIKVTVANQVFRITASIDNQTVILPLLIDGRQTIIQVPVPKVKEGCQVNIKGLAIVIQETPKKQDDLYNYVRNFLQWYFIILQMQDAIHEADIFRTNIILKSVIPFFYSHSMLSKYFTECIDYILKTEITLPPHIALRVRAGSFVTVYGREGKNKAADLQKENEVKLLKDLIRGLGANKTENSIILIAKAAPVISDISQNFDNMLGMKKYKTNHKKRSSAEDIRILLKILKTIDVWHFKNNRILPAFNGISLSPFNFENSLFMSSVEKTVVRLKRDLPCDIDHADEDEEEEENYDDEDSDN